MKQQKKRYIRIMTIIFCIYFLAINLTYFLAGDNFLFRQSKGQISMPTPNSMTIPLTKDTCVSTTFRNEIQIFEGFKVEFGDFARKNKSHVIVKLKDVTQNKLIYEKTIDASAVVEGTPVEFIFPHKFKDRYGHDFLLQIYSEDGESDSTIAVLIRKDSQISEQQVYYNEKNVNSILCFSTLGLDEIWIGKNYFKFEIITLVFLLSIIAIGYIKFKESSKSIVLEIIDSAQKYRFLISQMVSRDFKSKYKRSFLGIIWSFLNPLLMMIVQYIVFSTIFKADIANYHLYILIGTTAYGFFSEACNMTLNSIVGNSHLLSKVYIPKYIYPLVRVTSSSVNLSITLMPLCIIAIFSKVPFSKATFLAIWGLIGLILFALGIGMILATMMVFFRDTQFLWGVFSMIWMYLTPLFYPISILPARVLNLLEFNPLYYYILIIRTCLMEGISPEPQIYLRAAFASVLSITIGMLVFQKNKDKFIFYL